MFGVFIKWRERLSLRIPLLFCVVLLFGQYRIVLADAAANDVGLSEGLSSEGAAAPSQPDNHSSFLSDVQLSGYLKNETAYRYRTPRSFTKIRNIAYLNAKYPYSSRVKFNFSGWAYYDLAYDLFDYDTIAARFQRNSNEPLAYLVTLPKEKDLAGAEIRDL